MAVVGAVKDAVSARVGCEGVCPVIDAGWDRRFCVVVEFIAVVPVVTGVLEVVIVVREDALRFASILPFLAKAVAGEEMALAGATRICAAERATAAYDERRDEITAVAELVLVTMGFVISGVALIELAVTVAIVMELFVAVVVVMVGLVLTALAV